MVLGLIAFAVELALMMFEPLYRTYKIIKLSSASTPEDSRTLFIHWSVYALFRAVDWLLSPLPLFGLLKIGAIVWLRNGGGTEIVYIFSIEPFFAQNQPAIDMWLERWDKAKNTVTAIASNQSTR